MKGLELAERYYDDVVKPKLIEYFPDEMPRIAAGLVGEGSECFGYDDLLSRDHDWGARVCLWLTDEDYDNKGQQMKEMLQKLPQMYDGYPVVWIEGRSGIIKIKSFYKKYLGVNKPLRTISEWLSVPEHHLATASNGKVFSDPLGVFSEIRKDLLLGYPEDIRLKKIAAKCMLIGQSGQYNYPRLVKRQDKTAMHLAMAVFIEKTIQVVYLLNNRYAPFYKWMARGLRDLPVIGSETALLLNELQEEGGRQETIEKICEGLMRTFHAQGISDSGDAYMVAQGININEHIENGTLRNINPWLE